MPRSSPRTGSATFRTEKSSATMNWAAHSTKRTSLARASAAGEPSGGGAGLGVAGERCRRASGDSMAGRGVDRHVRQPGVAGTAVGSGNLSLVAAPPATRTDQGEYVAYAARRPAERAARRRRPTQELREFLMSRRARVTPAEAGLPDGGARRRTPGLRREEVAVLAGRGRLLVPVAGAGPRHHRLAAGPGRRGPGAAAEQRRAAPSLRPGRAQPARAGGRAGRTGTMCDGLQRLIDAWMPFPAHIMDRYWNTVVYNDAARLVLGMRPGIAQNCLIASSPTPCTGRGRRSWEKNAAPGRRAVPGRVLRRARRTRGSGPWSPRPRGAQPGVRRAVGAAATSRPGRPGPQGARPSARRRAARRVHPAAGARPAPTSMIVLHTPLPGTDTAAKLEWLDLAGGRQGGAARGDAMSG